MKIAVVGATGLVGGVMLQVLQERGFDHCDIIAAASPKSVGKTIPFAGRNLTVISVPDAINSRPDYAVFSAGASASRQYAPLFAQNGCTVIDNSSCWRMDDNVPLVVPEINMHSVSPQHRIIANPNCSTIQLVLALSGLHTRYHIRRLVVSTYQSITGTGIKAVRQLESEEDYYFRHHTPSATLLHDIEQDLGDNYQPAYPHQIFRNLFPHGGDFLPDGYTTEEQKLVNESRKILSTPELLVSATVARVPVVGGHSESVNVEFLDEFTLDDISAKPREKTRVSNVRRRKRSGTVRDYSQRPRRSALFIRSTVQRNAQFFAQAADTLAHALLADRKAGGQFLLRRAFIQAGRQSPFIG